MRFADIACGSGSFLIGVYEYLLDYHRKWYAKELQGYDKPLASGKNTPHNQHFGAVELRNSAWALTLRTKQDILLNNVFGVDLDAQAVEVTQLSLFLKMLEDESLATMAGAQLTLTSKVLPDLTKNIRCGNSLIGWDVDNGLFGDEELKKLNPFDWKASFPGVFRGGGFDAVVGNPPYVLGADEESKRYFAKNFKHQEGKPDLYRFFVEKAVDRLRNGGEHAYIIPASLLTIPAAKSLRKMLLNEGHLREIVLFYGEVFKGVSVNSLIYFFDKKATGAEIISITDEAAKPDAETLQTALGNAFPIPIEEVLKDPTLAIRSGKHQITESICKNTQPLQAVASYVLGMQVYHNTIHSKAEMEKRIYHSATKEGEDYYPESGGKNVGRYRFAPPQMSYVKYGERVYSKPAFKFFSQPRIIVREIPSATGLVAAYTDSTHISNKATIILLPTLIDIFLLLGIVNSRLLGFYVNATTEKGTQRLFPRISLTTVRNLPIPLKLDGMVAKQISQAAKALTQANENVLAARTDRDHSFLSQKVASLDRQIDELVYQLYNLTDEEIALVESA